MNKVIFLDVDGVLNNDGWARKMFVDEGVRVYAENLLEARALSLLKKLVSDTGAELVLSSAWRKIPSAKQALEEQLESYGMHISDCTGGGDVGERGIEIRDWLVAHPEVTHIAILDDDDDMASLKPFLVQTSWVSGLRQLQVECATNLLNEGIPWREGEDTKWESSRRFPLTSDVMMEGC